MPRCAKVVRTVYALGVLQPKQKLKPAAEETHPILPSRLCFVAQVLEYQVVPRELRSKRVDKDHLSVSRRIKGPVKSGLEERRERSWPVLT